jgi:cytoskeletal protein CcmA (bactofilin family)
MFRKRTDPVLPSAIPSTSAERVTSVLGAGISWKGSLGGSGGIRIEGTFEGNINLRGLLVVGETGRVTGETLKANTVIVAGAVRSDITAERVEIRATGRVWGNVVTAAFATEEGAFLRGQITMEEKVELQFENPEAKPEE